MQKMGEKSMEYIYYYESPLGRITLSSDGEALTGLWFDTQLHGKEMFPLNREERELPVFDLAKKWLTVYFDGKEPDFTPPLSPQGSTPFRRAVWEILLTIPYGQTMTYGEIAERIAAQRGIPRMSAQAVGGAVGHNPVSLIVPCHRVIGSDGSLTGYGGGLPLKEKLLTLEGIL